MMDNSQSFAETISASDDCVTYIGRTQQCEGRVALDWTASTIRLCMNADTLRMRISDTGRNRYNVYWNRSQSAIPDTIIETCQDMEIVLIAPYRGHNQLTLVKRTEGEQGRTTFHSFSANGHFFPASPCQRLIEFIGDSYSCGYGADGADSTSHFMMETESVCKAFPLLIADSLHADAVVIAHSGMGVIRNYNSKFADWTMPVRYEHTFDMDSTSLSIWHGWDKLRPIMTVVFLGGNDFSVNVLPNKQEFIVGYKNLLKQIKSHYGESHPILCVVKCNDTLLSEYVQEAVCSSSWSNISFIALNQREYMPDGRYRGADSHPNELAHQRIASTLIPLVQKYLSIVY